MRLLGPRERGERAPATRGGGAARNACGSDQGREAENVRGVGSRQSKLLATSYPISPCFTGCQGSDREEIHLSASGDGMAERFPCDWVVYVCIEVVRRLFLLLSLLQETWNRLASGDVSLLNLQASGSSRVPLNYCALTYM